MSAALYEVLGIEPDADEATIKRAYRKRAKETHPDRGGSAAVFTQVKDAYDVLISPDKRAQYDRERLNPSQPEPTPEFEDVDLDWGVEEQVAVPTYTSEPAPLAPSGPIKRTRFPVWSLAGALFMWVLGYVTLMLVQIDGTNSELAKYGFNTFVLLFPLATLRTALPRKAALTLSLNIAAFALVGVLTYFNHAFIGGLAVAAVMLLGAELCRRTIRRIGTWSQDRRYPQRWDALINAASQRGNHRYWAEVRPSPYGGRPIVNLWDPIRATWRRNVDLAQPVPAQAWIVLDAQGRMVASCADKVRVAWERTRP